MERNNGHRKACDLCYRKRIKCDAGKPRCSHCIVYDSACTYVSASRKTGSRKKAPASEAALQSRVESLEAELKLLSDKVEKLAQLANPAIDADHTQIFSLATGFEHVQQLRGSAGIHPARDLPPLQDVLPIVETYLATSNSVLPLFHPPTLLDAVKRWYWFPEGRDVKTWAAINVVLALAFRANSADAASPNPTRRTAEHVHNTQTVLAEVIMGDTDLVSVQVLVGLAMLLQGAQDLGPSAIIIATALRLAHRLGLQTRRSSAHLDRRLALQRSRVFWMAYILDRDISMRIRQTPLQPEAEIDVDLPADPPADAPADQAGCVSTADGLGRMNFFLARVQLARIQGKVYHCLFSVQSQHCSVDERTQQAAGIGSMLDAWMASIPHDFHPGRLSEARLAGLSRPLCVLYAARLTCLCLINRAHPWNAVWVQGLQDYGRSAAAGDELSSSSSSVLQLPVAWQALVDESRHFVRLFVSVPWKDASFIWMTICAHVSGLMCLAAHIICNPSHPAVEGDLALAGTALDFVDDLAKQVDREMLTKIRDTCTELISHARSIAAEGGDAISSAFIESGCEPFDICGSSNGGW